MAELTAAERNQRRTREAQIERLERRALNATTVGALRDVVRGMLDVLKDDVREDTGT